MRINRRRCISCRGRKYRLTCELLQKAESPGEKDRIRIISDADGESLQADLDRM